jgi:CubicO group peptidase (beta-lactamase class C family)
VGRYRHPRRREPWLEDRLVLVFSATVKLSKDNFQALSNQMLRTLLAIGGQSQGLATMTLAVAQSRGWLDYDQRVAAYWPEFARILLI